MLITIDGLSGTGKSSISMLLANDLKLSQICSGDYFRSYAYIISKEGLIVNNETINYLKTLDIKRIDNKVFVNNEDITKYLKTKEINILSAKIANNKEIQNLVNEIEHKLLSNNNIIDGRDVNSRFPEADYKFFLTAGKNTRIERMNSTKEEIAERDKYDIEGNIKKTNDIIEINTDNKTLGEIEKEILTYIGE